MAQRVLIELSDDLDGTVATSTVSFALDAKTYEIDLSDKNAAKLRKVLAPYVEVARKPGGRRGSRSVAQTGRAREEAQPMRTWLRENGHEVSDRGRIAADLVEAYEARAK